MTSLQVLFESRQVEDGEEESKTAALGCFLETHSVVMPLQHGSIRFHEIVTTLNSESQVKLTPGATSSLFAISMGTTSTSFSVCSSS